LTVKRIIAALVLGAMLVTVGIGCGGPSTPAKPATTPEKKEPDKTKPPT
jgi:hypothetical protein